MFQMLVTELTAWSRLLREQFQVVLLTSIFIAVFFTAIHMFHDGRDANNIAWVREIAGTVGGVLWGLLKGIQIGRASGEPTPLTATLRVEGDQGNKPV